MGFGLPLTALLLAPPSCTNAPTTAAERRETYAVVRATCFLAGATHGVCEAAVAMAWRESRGRPGLTHTRGKNEYGLGLFAHAPKYWAWLVDDRLDRFCHPITATLALLREFEFAVEGGAMSLRDLQRVHAGRPATRGGRGDYRWCHLLEHGPRDDQHVVTWAISCHTPITCTDVGGAAAQAFANRSGTSVGIEKPTPYQKWTCKGLPRPEFRQGYELRIESVDPETVPASRRTPTPKRAQQRRRIAKGAKKKAKCTPATPKRCASMLGKRGAAARKRNRRKTLTMAEQIKAAEKAPRGK